MSQITNFNELGEAIKQADYDFHSIDFTTKELETLKVEVLAFPDTVMKNATDILEDHYGMCVPVDFIKNILMEDLDLAYEVYSGGVADTCQRERLGGAVLRKIQMRHWPTNGEGDEVFQAFLVELNNKALTYGIKMLHME